MKRIERMKYKSKLAYNNEFNKENYKCISFRLSYANEKELIDWLDNFDNKKEYITNLIMKDMKRMKKKG